MGMETGTRPSSRGSRAAAKAARPSAAKSRPGLSTLMACSWDGVRDPTGSSVAGWS